MDFKHLKTFQSVARLLSFSRAARQLHYAQSSVSAQIQALEDELNVRLFDRLGRGILLTDAGARLLQYADKILALTGEAEAELAAGRQPAGELTIRVPESVCTYLFPPVIERFCARFPDVRLNLTTCAFDGLDTDLRKGVTDLAFLLADSARFADLNLEALAFTDIFPVAAPAHPLAKKRVVKTRDFCGEAVFFSKVDCSYRKIFEPMLQDAGAYNGPAVSFHSMAALKRCVARGLGITVMPGFAFGEEQKAGALVPLAWDETSFEAALLMIWYKERWLSPTLKAFMETAREMLKTSKAQQLTAGTE